MRMTAFAFALFLSFAAPIAAQEWDLFISRQDGFKVNFPGQPKITDTTWKSQLDYVLPARVYSATKGKETYSLTVVDYSSLEKQGIERSKKCPPGNAQCREDAGPVIGPGYWKQDERGAIVYATFKLLQRNAKVTQLAWDWQDLVEGHLIQMTNDADQSRTFAYVAMHEHKLYILEGTVPKGFPEPGLFQQSLGWVDKDGNGIRYQSVYSNAYHGMGVYAKPAIAGARGAAPPAAPGAASAAPQSRSITEGVFTAAQAARGRPLYEAQCAECHGKAMEGTVGPALAGDTFLSDWSTRPLVSFVDKIQKTMPFNLPATLTRQQSIELTAYILQAGKFPAGQTDLSDEMLARVLFPAAPRASATAAPSSIPGLAPPEGNLAELMRAIAFPNSNIIFNVQVKDPGAQAKKQLGTSPFDYVEWGSTVYPGWLAIDQAAIALTETAPLLLTPGRRCQNGRPVPVDRADWKQFVTAMAEVGKAAHRASQARDFKAFVDISEKLNDTCANCHKVYRDKGGAEGSGAARCQP